MYNVSSCFLWLSLVFLILMCELYVPYRIRLFFSFSLGALASCFSSFLFEDIFKECVFFISASVFFYSFSLVLKSSIGKERSSYCSVISLCDIDAGTYGRVYSDGKSYVIKNREGIKIKKGEVLKLKRALLEGESLVP